MLENGFGFPQWSKIYPRYPLVLKYNVTLARPLHLVIRIFFNINSCQMIGTCIYFHDSKSKQVSMSGKCQYFGGNNAINMNKGRNSFGFVLRAYYSIQCHYISRDMSGKTHQPNHYEKPKTQ